MTDGLDLDHVAVVVRDLDVAERFYREVFGMKPDHRVETQEHKYALDEVIMSLEGAPGAPAGHALILTRYLERPCPPAGAAWTGFVVADIDATIAAVERAGGRSEVPVHENAEHGVRAAIVADPDGHLIELIQMLAPQ